MPRDAVRAAITGSISGRTAKNDASMADYLDGLKNGRKY